MEDKSKKNEPESKSKPDDTGSITPSAHLRIKDITDGKNDTIVDKRG